MSTLQGDAPTSRWWCGATGAALAVGVTGLWSATVVTRAWAEVAAPGPMSADEGLVLVAALAATSIAVWLSVALVVSVVAQVPGRLGRAARTLQDHVSPALIRRTAAFLVGVGTTGALLPGTAAADTPPPGPGVIATAPRVAGDRQGEGGSPAFAPTGPRPVTEQSRATTDAPSVREPGAQWRPTRPRVRPMPAPELVVGRTREAPPEVVVLRGDTLWGIVAAHLGDAATDAEVTREWPRWHAANRDVIGPDPDRLLPGQVLHAPEAVAR
ncbi:MULTISPECIES: LysM peptidoglycan-binding domain-containing protein [unclassified Janibacter]|uniref:LysM peptidoglycan-binding domain-containing protein n=1 Tax=unclassified Janibacter TaxID=2649294 RepID=UPI003D034B1B